MQVFISTVHATLLDLQQADLLGSEFNFNNNNDTTGSALAIHMNLIAGYNIDLNTNWRMTPSAILKYAEQDNISYEATLMFTNHEGSDDKFYFGFAYRDSEGPSALAGIYLTEKKNLRLGYAFDLVIQGQNAKERTSHEVMLSYRMPAIKIIPPGVIHTPRFKHFTK